MEIGEFSEQVHQIVSSEIATSDKETELVVDKDHCAFYATQAALKHFNGTVLSGQTRDEMYKEREDINGILAHNNQIGWNEAATYALVLPRLEKEGIIPTTLLTSEDKSYAIETLTQSFGLSLENIPSVGDGMESVGIELPALLMSGDCKNPEKAHIWFCPDAESWQSEMDQPFHTKNNPDLQVVISLAKKPLDIP